MENNESPKCPECGGKLAPRCRQCHKHGYRCGNLYCMGDGEVQCLSCRQIFIKNHVIPNHNPPELKN